MPEVRACKHVRLAFRAAGRAGRRPAAAPTPALGLVNNFDASDEFRRSLPVTTAEDGEVTAGAFIQELLGLLPQPGARRVSDWTLLQHRDGSATGHGLLRVSRRREGHGANPGLGGTPRAVEQGPCGAGVERLRDRVPLPCRPFRTETVQQALRHWRRGIPGRFPRRVRAEAARAGPRPLRCRQSSQSRGIRAVRLPSASGRQLPITASWNQPSGRFAWSQTMIWNAPWLSCATSLRSWK